MNTAHDHTTAIGTLSGTAMTVIANIGSDDIIKTAVLAAVGAAVSFVATIVLKWIYKQLKKLF